MTADVQPVEAFFCDVCDRWHDPAETPVARVAREDHTAEVRLYGEPRVAELEKEANR